MFTFFAVPTTAEKPLTIHDNKILIGPPAPLPVLGPVYTPAKPARPNKPAKSKTTVASGQCNCLLAINTFYKTNFKTTDGYARSIPVNSKTPAETGFVITRESWMGHIAHYYKSGDLIVIDYEGNYERCRLSSGRTLPVASRLIKGYIN